ncbi:MAG TPA: hypothetical protein VEZ47_05470, partial [Gemmatirosa sp.]|nr:hypothetical protein [Gemmatirosa sp.]
VDGAVWHGGAQPGTSAVLYILPEDRVVVAVLTNLEGLGSVLVPAADRIARLVAEQAVATRPAAAATVASTDGAPPADTVADAAAPPPRTARPARGPRRTGTATRP